MSKTLHRPSQKKATLESNLFLLKVCQTFLLGPWSYISASHPASKTVKFACCVPSSRLRGPSVGCPSREGWALFSGCSACWPGSWAPGLHPQHGLRMLRPSLPLSVLLGGLVPSPGTGLLAAAPGGWTLSIWHLG